MNAFGSKIHMPQAPKKGINNVHKEYDENIMKNEIL
jgi:hypothetical protein